MIDITTAINYLEQTVDHLKQEHDLLESDKEDLKSRQKQLVLDTEALAQSKSAFIAQTGTQTRENERADKMHALALKLKAQVDVEREELADKTKLIEEREKDLIDLEAKQKTITDKEALLEVRIIDVTEREELVDKEKEAARSKQKDLEIREKGIKKQQERLQAIITQNNA